MLMRRDVIPWAATDADRPLRWLTPRGAPSDVVTARLAALLRHAAGCTLASMVLAAAGCVESTELREDSAAGAAYEERCGASTYDVDFLVDAAAGGASVQSKTKLAAPGCATGRRPEGLVTLPQLDGSQPLAAFFTRVAYLEAASVHAFRTIAEELRAYAAPAALVAQAERAVEDELVHTTLTSALSRRFGGEPALPEVPRRPLRSLEAFAIDNAIEGCVRETYGAAVASYQARAARDDQSRAAFVRIADDETRHASLSLQLADWVAPRLSDDARARVLSAQRAALVALGRELQTEPAPELQHAVGLPSARAASKLLAHLHQGLWSV